MRRSAATLAPGGHSGFPDGPTRPTAPLRAGIERQENARAFGSGTGLGKAAERGADPCPILLPATSALALPTLSPEIPQSFEQRSEKSVKKEAANVMPELLEALYRERIIQPRHWEPGKRLLQVATDGLEEWAHRRGRLTTHPLHELGFIELHVAADIMTIGGKTESDWYECPWDAGWHCISEKKQAYPPAALGLDNSGQTARTCALKPWVEMIQREFGDEIARSFVGVLNTAVEDIEGWGPGYAYERALGWDEHCDDEDSERLLTMFEQQIPKIALSYSYKYTHLYQIAERYYPFARLRNALIALARAIPRPWKRRMPKNISVYEMSYWGSNHVCSIGAHPMPPAAFCWSDDVLPEGGHDAVLRVFDDEHEMIHQAENIDYFWLYAFDPKREGDGPGTLRFALESLGRQLRLLKALDEVLTLLDHDPDQMRITV